MNIKKKIINFLILTFFISIISIILIFSPGIKSSLKNEYLLVLNKTSYPHEDYGRRNNISNILNDISRLSFYKNQKTKFQKIYLNIKFKNLNKLYDSRKKSLELHKSNQYLLERIRVPAEIIYKEKKYKARVR